MQVYDLPVGFMIEWFGQAIGDYIGVLVEVDLHNFTGGLRSLMHILVGLDIRKPLKQKMKL